MKKLNVHIEERLLWKLFQFGGFGQTDVIDENLDETDYDTRQYVSSITLSFTCMFVQITT